MSNFNSEKAKKIQRIGCFGCLTYIFLFATAAAGITYLGLDTLWVVPFMAVFVFFWFMIYWRALKSK
jgi:hypothetical protein